MTPITKAQIRRVDSTRLGLMSVSLLASQLSWDVAEPYMLVTSLSRRDEGQISKIVNFDL